MYKYIISNGVKTMENSEKIYSIPSLRRLPQYLRELKKLKEAGRTHASSTHLAKSLKIDSISARKDVELVGVTGSPGVGFEIDKLIDGIETFLGWKNASEAFLAGTSDFGRALMHYGGFDQYSLKIIAAFDKNVSGASEESDSEIPVFPLDELPRLAKRMNIHLGILCVPDEDAQKVAELMVSSGILAIWNFTNHTLDLPDNIIRRKVNLAGDLAILSVKLAEKLRETDML